MAAQRANTMSATVGRMAVVKVKMLRTAIAASVGIGALTSAILVTNNLRDIPTDRSSGKLTLAVRLGDSKTRALYVALIVIAFVAVVAAAYVYMPDFQRGFATVVGRAAPAFGY